MMSTPKENTATPSDSAWYEIQVRGHLGPEWSDWFEGLELSPREDGDMVLSGSIVDQAALLGVLTRLNRLNLPLLSVRSREEQPEEAENG